MVCHDLQHTNKDGGCISVAPRSAFRFCCSIVVYAYTRMRATIHYQLLVHVHDPPRVRTLVELAHERVRLVVHHRHEAGQRLRPERRLQVLPLGVIW